MTRFVILSMIQAAVAFAAAAAVPNASLQSVMPVPRQVVERVDEGGFAVGASTPVEAPAELAAEADFLRGYLAEVAGAVEQASGPIRLRATLSDTNPEAYAISVYPDSLVIDGASAAGTFWGVQTLRKALGACQEAQPMLPVGTVYDYPRFAYRGAHFDVSRHFFTLDEVKRFIDMMVLHNMNTFHWHLTDDQGWRLEIKKYPKLTEVGARRAETVVGRNPGKWDGKPVEGYYTQEEAREIVDYAAKRHITVVPEIEMPGHTRALIAAYPELGCTGGPYDVWTCWGVTEEVLCAGNDDAMQLLADVLGEVMDIFPSQYINVGGDECPKDRWAECGKCQERIRKEGIEPKDGLTAEQRLQGYVTSFAGKVVADRGRTMIGWDEILEGDIPADAVVMSWRGIGGALEGTKRGHRVVMTPNTHCYFDFYQTKDTQFEPFAIGGYLPPEKVYAFDPLEGMDADQARLVLGVQCNLWTEYILDFPQVEYMELPRMAALSQVQWADGAIPGVPLAAIIGPMLRNYDRLGYNYARHILDAKLSYTPDPAERCLRVEATALPADTIRYTLDGSDPDATSAIFPSGDALRVSDSCVLKAVAYHDGRPGRVICDTISTNLATFAHCRLLSTPAPNYGYDGAPTLVDGIRGNGNYRTGRWLGFVGNDADVALDLGRTVRFSEVEFQCNLFSCDGVVDAVGAEVYVDCGTGWELVYAEDFAGQQQGGPEFGTSEHLLRLPEPAEASRVRVVVKSQKRLPDWHYYPGAQGFVFVDEINLR